MLQYLNYENLNIEEELNKIRRSKYAEIVLEPNNKKCLFILGMLFVNGINIKILNEEDLKFEDTNKSFTMMSYVWSKIGNDKFPLSDYSNVKTEMDKRIENVKRLGVKLDRIIDNPIENKIFLICPVRNATEEQRKWIEDFVHNKYNEGYTIHAPHLHTRQTDMFGGYAICKQNAEAVASSQEIDIYYDQSSTGSVFDLGVAYALNKSLRLLNKEEIVFDENDLIDMIIKDWPLNNNSLMKWKELKDLFYRSFSKETCSEGLRNKWSIDNPSLGHCAVTALILNDIYGGKIMRCMASTGSHYYNMIDDELVDLTVEQFQGETPEYEKGEERSRDYLLSNADTRNRYEQLLSKVRSNLIYSDYDKINGDKELNKYKDYLNDYYMFSTFEIIWYKKDDNFEYIRFDLAGQNTGLVIDVKHDLKTHEYDYSPYHEVIPIPVPFFEALFAVARKYKDNIELEELLTETHIKSKTPRERLIKYN